MFYSVLKPFFFQCDPEHIHEFIMKVAHLGPQLGKLTGTKPSDKLSLKIGHLKWRSPVGLAAGLDKNAEALDFFSHQGFGALECGTITLKPQLGNPRPRMFRYIEEKSLRNSMGFPNHGLMDISKRLHHNFDLPIGANIGKNKDSTPDESLDELGTMVATLNDDVDYFVVNVSSPNTPGLRALQERGYLTELFSELKKLTSKNLFIKIAPDLEQDKIMQLASLSHELNLTGIIATNTTIMPERGVGGISGKLLQPKARRVHEKILSLQLPIEVICVGGISHFDDIKSIWRMGGKAVQVYSAYVFEGPQLLKKINSEILHFLNKNAISDLETFFSLPLQERIKLLDHP
jgi:dihydroorotate dehydrogenase